MNITSTTLLINTNTLEYPIGLFRVRLDFPNVSFAAEPSEEFINEMGYAVVHFSDMPEGDVVVEIAPTIVNGIYQQAWQARDYSPEESAANLINTKQTLSTKVDTLRDVAMSNGFNYDFGQYGIQGVQTKESDKINVIGLRVSAESSINAGRPNTMYPFRTTENNIVSLTATEVVALTDYILYFTTTIYGKSWVLKDQIQAATSKEELPAIPESMSMT